MKLAVPIFEGRVSPVFDVARRILLMEEAGGEVVSQDEISFSGSDRVRALSTLAVDVVICGAVSRQIEERLLAQGVEVESNVSGPVGEVVRVFLAGNLMQRRFSMPGCHGKRLKGGGRGSDLRNPKLAAR
jgi:predicted Fe-Mo cluster-binding NifX family protein